MIYLYVVKTDSQIQSDCPFAYFTKLDSNWSWQSVFETGCVFHKISNYSSLRASNSVFRHSVTLIYKVQCPRQCTHRFHRYSRLIMTARGWQTSKNITGNVEIPFPAPHFSVCTPFLSIISCSALVTWLSYTITSHRLLRVPSKSRGGWGKVSGSMGINNTQNLEVHRLYDSTGTFLFLLLE